MKKELINFETISRQTWQRLHRDTTVPLTQEELNSIKSLNDKISLQEVLDIYLPLINLISIYKKANEDLSFFKSIFLQEKNRSRPFIIGISGSVAVGKSTTSRLLQILLSRRFKWATVEMVTTDGFLYPNHGITLSLVLRCAVRGCLRCRSGRWLLRQEKGSYQYGYQ